MPIQVTKRRVSASQLTPSFVQQVYAATQQYVRFPDLYNVSVAVVGRTAMRQLNRTYRSVDVVTDVLSFPYDEMSGEVVICYDQAKQQALDKQTSLRHELAWLLIHGFLHVRGYDHETADDAKIMRPLERKILTHLFTHV